MTKPSRDLQKLAERVFGEPAGPDLLERLERLTAALEALRERLRPDATPFEERMEAFARGAGKPVRLPLRGDLEDDAPGLLLDPRFWLNVHAARRAALYGDTRATKSLEIVLEALAVSKRRKARAKREAAERLRESAKAQAATFERNPGFVRGLPDVRAAVEAVRGKRGPTSLESAVRLWRSEKGRQKLPELLRAQAKAMAALEAAAASAKTRDALATGRADEAASVAVSEVERLQRELRATAATIKAKAKRARKAGKTRVAK